VRLVVALGGNALIRRGEAPTAANQRHNVRVAAQALASIAPGNQLVITHGNGPQVGLLALQAAAFEDVRPYPLDVLGAQTEGAIGYMIEQELGNLLPEQRPFATILTMVEVDPGDPAFRNPTKPIGPSYSEEEARALALERGWSVAPDGKGWRRVVPSPRPKRIFEIRPIRWLLGHNVIVICSGGGGIPTMFGEDGKLHGVEAVIDKDWATAMLAEQVGAQRLVLATDTEAVYLDWGTPDARPIHETTPEELRGMSFPEGSMGPKVEAACTFVERTGKPAAIGSLAQIGAIVEGAAGTQLRP
jgi:carbamate kinase